MRERREKGVILVFAIVLLCLFLIFTFVNPSKGQSGNQTNFGDLSNLLNNDISVADSGRDAQEEYQEEPKDEVAFLMEHLSFSRSGSQMMTGIFAGILIMYLIVIGPVSYFYLKKIGKMENMWLIIPAASLVFGCCILLFGNAYPFQEPQTDVLTILCPGEQSVSYVISTSRGEDSLLEKDYAKWSLEHIQEFGFQYTVVEQDEVIKGSFTNESGYDFSHVMLCFGQRYCVIPAVEKGGRFEVEERDWRMDEYGVSGDLKDDLILQLGLTEDEKQIFSYAWFRYVSGGNDGLYITGIVPEYDAGMTEDSENMISYGLFCQ